MHYKTKSLIVISTILAFMIGISLLLNNIEGQITGAAVTEDCACSEDAECIDDNPCTEDLCLYADSCRAAVCLHNPIENCE